MITPTEAGRIVTRLAEHWPSIAAGDHSARDWIAVVSRCPHANEVADLLINGWERDRAPRVADWQACARQHAYHHHAEQDTTQRRALEAADRPVAADRIADLIADARARIHPTPPHTPHFRSAVSYTMIPVRWGDPGTTMTVEDHDTEAARFQHRLNRKHRR